MFRVGVTADVRRADGTPVYDLELLDRRSGVATPLGHDLDLVTRFGG